MKPSCMPRRQRGFSLIEIMVGLAIGLVATIIMMQMFLFSDNSRRITSGGDDAQINGGIALSGLERDIRMAGYGLNSFNLLGCTLSLTPRNESGAVANPLTIAPVVINPSNSWVPAGDTNTDTLLVMYGNGNSPSEGDAVVSVSGASYLMATATSFTQGDQVLPLPMPRSATCALTVDSVAAAPTAPTITVTTGASVRSGDILYNLGATPVIRAYAIRSGNLTVCDYTAYDCGKAAYVTSLNNSVWVPVASNIVSLRAEYGRDVSAPTMTGLVSSYTQVTPGSSASVSAYTLACDWGRMLSVRMALVARSAQYDKGSVTSTSPTWIDAGNLPIDLSGNASWQHYRYKTLQTAIPLRDMLWQGGQPGYQGGSSGC